MKMNNKYLIEFNQTGVSTVNVDLIVKDWNEKFVISQYSPPDKKPDILISIGDFGFWAPYDYDLYKRYIMLNGDGDEKAAREYAQTKNWVNKIKPQNTKIYFWENF